MGRESRWQLLGDFSRSFGDGRGLVVKEAGEVRHVIDSPILLLTRLHSFSSVNPY
jgi:hypothetical protein